MTGLPKTLTIGSENIIEALEEPLRLMLRAVHYVLENTPPELASDIAESGICITGGGAYLYGIDRLISENTGLPCFVAEDAISCVAMGTGIAADNANLMQDNAMTY